MNPDLDRLHAYPFERLRQLLSSARPPAQLRHIDLSIGEPKHPTPPFILEALARALPGIASYPSTAGTAELRQAIAAWLQRRFDCAIDAASQVLPVNGTREALFAFAQAVVDRSRAARVVSPNPFYQIYEGAALLAGATPLFLPTTPDNGFRMAFDALSPREWNDVQLVYVCTPGNPTGRVMTLDEWRTLFELSDRHRFVIAADECYSEIYFDEAHPPLGSLAAARSLGRTDFRNLVSFGSLSKRSSVPGLRSGYAAGDVDLIRRFLLYRTYHGNAMSPAIQVASAAAWNEEAHVRENRRLYAAKFEQATPLIARRLVTAKPEAAFYLWAKTPIDEVEYARCLYAECNITVLPGSFLARESGGSNPGRGYVRIALVADPAEVAQAAARIEQFQP